MEVAGQWRREWAGTAEYGKVVEGGVTRRVARAMEVLNASAPGARVRVMRAAYHSSAGPGAPTASYLMHSSRQVLSSGYNFLEPSSLPTKPLEISSMPLDSSPDRETENYKVTEPDDFDISEPSKWRASTGKSSIRMPSEESSSTDNASIIDLDSRSSSRNNIRRSFNGKHDINRINGNSRVSPLLDAPTALSTLKYTSLLNASDDWNNRRKSYSFEDTSPLNKIISPGINLSIESSTDSGICKSSEIFQDNSMILKNKEKYDNNSEFTFKDWLSKNRENSYKEIKISHPKIVHVESKKTNITLQSTGKVTITLPTDTYSSQHSDVQSRSSDDNDRKTKKVEFCKTELHFAADTGTVNIIATDEKPPPSNDFRRRRSAFVPLNEKSDRSITLFGDKSDISEKDTNFGISNYNIVDTDENTAATRSILKNKIPKPKPYLLGENMVFGTSSNVTNDDISINATVPSAVSLINRQLHSERRYSNDTISSITSEIDSGPLQNIQNRKIIKDPLIRGSPNQRPNTSEIESSFKYSSKINHSKPSSVSPTPSRSKIRELRGSELAYFGIPKDENLTFTHSENNLQEEILHSVKLVQQISNSVCNSEAESDDGPEYQNMPTNFNHKMQPTPKPRTKYSDETIKMKEHILLQPITEQDTEIEIPSKINRNTVNNFGDPLLRSSRKHHENTTRQIKNNLQNHIRKTSMDDTSLLRRKENNSLKKVKQTNEKEQIQTSRKTSGKEIRKSESPLYVNLDSKRISDATTKNVCRNLDYKQKSDKNTHTESRRRDKEHVSSLKRNDRIDKNKENFYAQNGDNHDIQPEQQSPLVKKRAQRRTEKLCTPDNLPVYSTKKHVSMDNEVAARKIYDKYKNINNDSLDKHGVQNTPIKITAVSASIDKHKKESVHNTSKKDTIRIPKVATDINNSRNSDGTLSDKKHTSKSNRNTINSQQSSKSNQSKIIIAKLDKPVKPHRSKYVINYDDKNGTVSSVCKIKSGPVMYKRKMISIDNKDHKEPNKGLNKIALLSLPERQWITSNHQNKNKRKSPQEQRSCQLL